MHHKSRRPKPPTGMEMTVTLSMPADQTVEQSAAALVTFFERVAVASHEIGSCWLNIRCAGIPEELEGRLQAAFDNLNKRPTLTLAVDNDRTA